MNDCISHCDVIVVGAGIAGLVAADALSRAGRTVKVFEARDRIGGRASTITYDGLAIDLGATWYWPNEPLVRSALSEFGIANYPQSIQGDALFEGPGREIQRLDGNPVDTQALRFLDGAQSLPKALAGRIACGVLSTSEPVHAIRQDRGRIVVKSRSTTLSAEHVVLALPPALAVQTIAFSPEIPAEIRAAADGVAVWMGDMVKAIAVYRTPFWRGRGLAGAAISYRGPFREVHDHSGPQPNGLGALFGFAPAAAFPNASEDEIADAFRAQLDRMFGPEANRPERIVVTNWAKEKYTTPDQQVTNASTASFGHHLLQRPTMGSRVHWASTETAVAHAGHIEGAIGAGIHAAKQIESSFKNAGYAQGHFSRSRHQDLR